jgi:hypothetical protein
MTITRGRAYVRAWRGSAGDIGTAAIVGLIETPDALVDEATHDVVMTRSGDRLSLVPTGGLHVTDPRWGDAFDDGSSEIDDILTGRQWVRPRADQDMDGGGVVLRRSAAPAPEGSTVYVFVALVCTDAFEDDTMVDIAGCAVAGMSLAIDRRPHGMSTRGSRLSTVLHDMTFDWHDGPWRITSSIHLDVMAECMALQKAHDGVPTDPAVVERLKAGPAGWMLSQSDPANGSPHGHDADYLRFRAMMIERMGDEIYRVWRGWEPAAANDARERLAEDVVRTIMAA